MTGTKYEDRKGRTVTVENVENNIAILNNGERVAVERLSDNNFYTPLGGSNGGNMSNNVNESMDNSQPHTNTNDGASSRYEQLINNFQSGKQANIGIVEDDSPPINYNSSNTSQGHNPMVNVSMGNSVVESHSSNVQSKRQQEPQSDKPVPVVQPYRQPTAPKKEEPKTNTEKDIYGDNLENRINAPIDIDPQKQLLDKYKDNSPKSHTALSKLAYGDDYDEEKEKSNDKSNPNNTQSDEQRRRISELNQIGDLLPTNEKIEGTIEPIENPVYQMFDKAKKTHSLNVNLKINEKIPEKDIIKMMEENFDESAIDYYTKQIFIKLMEDPKIIEDQVREAITKYVNSRKKSN